MATYSSTLTAKGQMTMPVEIRRAFNLQPGDEIEFVVLRDGRLLMRPLNAAASAFFEAVPPRPPAFASDRDAVDALMIERSSASKSRAAE
jgi:AbrB family looped-hinge helix DNA binding protein